MHRNLGEFISALERAGELVRVKAPVDPVLEIAAIADAMSKARAPGAPSASARRTDPRFHDFGGKAVLFENVIGSTFPVLINAFGSYKRVEMALNCDSHAAALRLPPGAPRPDGLEALAARIGSLVKPQPPAGLWEMFAKARELLPLLRMPPRRRRGGGACQQVVITGDAIDLTTLPLIRCWPSDGDFGALGYPPDVNAGVPGAGAGAEWDAKFRGRYITLAGIHTIHAEDEGKARPPSHNIGMYRVQLLGKRIMAMHWHMHHDGARHWRSWKERGRPMPVAVVLGGESVLPYAATAPLPPGISELLLAGFLHGRGIEMVRAKTVPLWVPANAEIVIEGWVSEQAGMIGWDPREANAGPLGPGAVFEGPFGDHTGFYSLPDRYPVLTVSAVTHRRDAVYPTTVVGLPPQEDYALGKATERVFLPLLKTIVHDIEDYDLPMFGAFHNCACVKIRKSYPMQGRRVMHSIWGAGQMAWTKTIFVVDDDVDVHDVRAVLRAAARNCHPLRDVETAHGPLDILDHAAPRLGTGTKIGFDCTRKVEGDQAWGIELEGSDSNVVDEPRILELCRAMPGVQAAALHEEQWLVVSINKQAVGDGGRICKLIGAHTGLPRFVIVVAHPVDPANLDQSLFHWCANTDATRDRYCNELPTDGLKLIFDATPKLPGEQRLGYPVRSWPPVLSMPGEITRRVASRWNELGFMGTPMRPAPV